MNCHLIDKSSSFHGFYTNQTFDIALNNRNVSCSSNYVIYKITCNTCKLDYIGETKRIFRSRLSEHKSGIIGGNTKDCKILYGHFRQGCHGFKIQIIELINITGDDLKDKETLRKREDFWIRQLRTKYPYGLNDKLDNEDPTKSVLLQMKNNTNSKKKRYRTKIPRSKHKSRPDAIKYITECHRMFALDKSKARKLIFNEIITAPNTWIKKLSIFITDRVRNPVDDLIKDIISARLNNQKSVSKRRTKKPKILINHINKWIGTFNFHSLFNDSLTLDKWPSAYNTNYSNPMIIWKYTNSIASNFFNYRQTIEDLDLSNTNLLSIPCNCTSSIFTDVNRRHIVTGNTAVVCDSTVQKFLNLGASFRPPRRLNRTEMLASMDADLSLFIGKITRDLNTNIFDEWKTETLNKFKDTLNSSNDVFIDRSLILSHETKAKISSLQSKYVFTTVDKASKNFAIICKRHYVETIADETGFMNGGNSTYELSTNSIDYTVNKLRGLSNKFGIAPSNDQLKLPFIQITPKFHKNPISFRTIIASKLSVTKKLSKDIGKCLKLILYNLTKYCNTISKATHLQPNWIMNNSQGFGDLIQALGDRKQMKSIATFDFEKMYTNLHHDQIMDAMNFVINLGFGFNKRFIRVNDYRATWSTGIMDNRTYSNDQLIEMISSLISNSYFTFGKAVIRQKIGIPMGTDCAPYIANLFLFSYEYRYVMDLIKRKEFNKAFNLRHVGRYIDDISSVNDNGFLENNFKDIYPDTLNLKKMNGNDDKIAEVLDLKIIINPDGTCSTAIFDKRDGFPFEIINFPDPRGNINMRCCINVFGEEISRYLRLSNNYPSFLTKSKNLKDILIKKLYPKSLLTRKFEQKISTSEKFKSFNINRRVCLFDFSH